MNIQGLLKQAQQMQATVAKVEKQLNATVYAGTVGGDAVRVEVTGAYVLQKIEINEELCTKESKEELQDMVMLAINGALEAAKKDRDEKMNVVTQGVKIPGMF